MQEIDELIEKFKTADDENYTLFTYVNELNQEIAKLEEQVKVIEGEIEAAQQQAVARESSRLKTQLEVRCRAQAVICNKKLWLAALVVIRVERLWSL